jgi:hypothetical protein
MFYKIPTSIEDKLNLYRVVQRKCSKDPPVTELPSLGYIVAKDTMDAFKQLTKEYGASSGYIPVLLRKYETKRLEQAA